MHLKTNARRKKKEKRKFRVRLLVFDGKKSNKMAA